MQQGNTKSVWSDTSAPLLYEKVDIGWHKTQESKQKKDIEKEHDTSSAFVILLLFL